MHVAAVLQAVCAYRSMCTGPCNAKQASDLVATPQGSAIGGIPGWMRQILQALVNKYHPSEQHRHPCHQAFCSGQLPQQLNYHYAITPNTNHGVPSSSAAVQAGLTRSAAQNTQDCTTRVHQCRLLARQRCQELLLPEEDDSAAGLAGQCWELNPLYSLSDDGQLQRQHSLVPALPAASQTAAQPGPSIDHGCSTTQRAQDIQPSAVAVTGAGQQQAAGSPAGQAAAGSVTYSTAAAQAVSVNRLLHRPPDAYWCCHQCGAPAPADVMAALDDADARVWAATLQLVAARTDITTLLGLVSGQHKELQAAAKAQHQLHELVAQLSRGAAQPRPGAVSVHSSTCSMAGLGGSGPGSCLSSMYGSDCSSSCGAASTCSGSIGQAASGGQHHHEARDSRLSTGRCANNVSEDGTRDWILSG